MQRRCGRTESLLRGSQASAHPPPLLGDWQSYTTFSLPPASTQVFDDRKLFADWFGGDTSAAAGGGDDWLEKEKRVVVIHRLHQILEPFMLRRQVEDVETKLPPKVAVTIKVAMPSVQAAIYDWVKTTGTLRLDPAGEGGRGRGRGTAGRGRAWEGVKGKPPSKLASHGFDGEHRPKPGLGSR